MVVQVISSSDPNVWISSTVEKFAEKVKDKIGTLTLMSCSSARGEVGEKLLKKLEEAVCADVVGFNTIITSVETNDGTNTEVKWFTAGDIIMTDVEEEIVVAAAATAADILAYPNPTSAIVNCILPPSFKGSTQILLLDSHGRLLQTHVTNNISSERTIPLSLQSYPVGIYHLKVINKQQIISKKSGESGLIMILKTVAELYQCSVTNFIISH